MDDLPEFEFSSDFDQTPNEAKFFAWQVALADQAENSLRDADDFPNYIVNRDSITQMLGIGMSSGKNAFTVDDQLFVVAVSEQVDGQIKLIDTNYPRYSEMAALISEKLLEGKDKGMLSLLPNGRLLAINPPSEF